MDIALCYESVLPARGGAETYIGDLARRLARDGHAVHLYACRWDAAALPTATHFHRLDVPKGPRFLRPWRFAAACQRALASANHDVTVGFDKTWGQDVLYPQGGLHAASGHHNLLKSRTAAGRWLAAAGKLLDPAAWSFARLERQQYLGLTRPIVVVNSRMVRGHFERFYGVGPESLRVVHSAIDPLRFAADDRLKRRAAERESWGVEPDDPVGLFVAMNYAHPRPHHGSRLTPSAVARAWHHALPASHPRRGGGGPRAGDLPRPGVGLPPRRLRPVADREHHGRAARPVHRRPARRGVASPPPVRRRCAKG